MHVAFIYSKDHERVVIRQILMLIGVHVPDKSDASHLLSVFALN